MAALDLLAVTAAGMAIFAGFAALEDGKQTTTSRQKLARRWRAPWLRLTRQPRLLPWPLAFAASFDRAFGRRKLTVRCFGLSYLASL